MASWAFLGAAVLFAVASAAMHDYRLGGSASAYARGVVAEACENGKRIIVLNGVCDEQIEREIEREVKKKVERKGGGGQRNCSTSTFSTLSLRDDDAYRKELVAWVKAAFPVETNLWMAAQVGAAAFVEEAVKQHPERFYLMNGRDTTLEAWEKRWADFRPYLASSDPFVPMARRMFGREGNCIANAMLEGGKGEKVKMRGEGEQWYCSSVTSQASSAKAAWQVYNRIYEEIDPGNAAALVNMSEMVRRGHSVGAAERNLLQNRLDAFFSDPKKRKRAREIVRAAGPVRADPELIARMDREAKKRLSERIAAGEKVEVSPEVLSLVEWSNEMVTLLDRGELVRAGRIARKILANPKWHGFAPANAVMGAVAASEGDYMSSAAFFRTATDTTNAVPVAVLNDYADTLMHLGRMDEAERMARRAVAASDEKCWLARLALAEVLERKSCKRQLVEVVQDGVTVERYVRAEGSEKMEAEAKVLMKSVLRHAPAQVREKIRSEHKGIAR